MFQVQKQACSTCIYRKDSPLDLKKLEADIADQHMKGFFAGFRICHHSKKVCCRGFWNKHRDHFTAGQIAQRLNMVQFVSIDNMKKTEAPLLTKFQRRTLEALAAAYPKCVLHEKLYAIMFPTGRFNTDKDMGNTKGGPSRMQCAVNWHLGKFGNLVRREDHENGFGWSITADGRAALKGN